MPTAIGSTITISAGQPQRENSDINIGITYDAAGTPHFTFTAYGKVFLRDGSGNILAQNPAAQLIVSYTDANLPAGIRTALTSACTFLDTIAPTSVVIP